MTSEEAHNLLNMLRDNKIHAPLSEINAALIATGDLRGWMRKPATPKPEWPYYAIHQVAA